MSLSDSLSEDALEQQAVNEDLQAALRRAQKEIARLKAKKEFVAHIAAEAATEAVLANPLGRIPKPKLGPKRGSEEVALWHLTDWQGAKKTTSYNTQVMRDRVRKFTDKAESITEIQRKNATINKCVIMLGGDMIEGLFNFPTQPFEIDATLFEQYVNVANLLTETVSRALSIYKEVEVIAEWGNHGRLGSRRDAVPRNDNADRMTYELARQQLVQNNANRLIWEDCPEDIQRVQVGNYRAILIHGDEIGRGGYSSVNTMVNHVNRWRSGGYAWDFQDAYIGHYHTHYQMSLADGLGAMYGTGSTESDNRYASVGLAASSVPSQRLHFVNPDKGRVTSVYQVWLD